MIRYVAVRVLHILPVLLVSSIAIFLLLRLLPGNPADVLAGPDASPETVAALRHQLGLDRPLLEQFGIWLLRVLRGDLGTSAFSHYPVSELIGRRLWASGELALVAMGVTLLVALPLGVMAALRRGRLADFAASVYQSVLLAVPNFWFGILAILLFSVTLGWLPPGGYIPMTDSVVGNLKSVLLPAVTLGLPTAAALIGIVRAAVIEELGKDYVRTAGAKGIAERRVVGIHVLRNAMGPVVVMLGVTLGRLIGASVVVEAVFSWPGIGSLLISSIANRDYAIVQGTLLIFVLIIVLINLLTDVLHALIDPRIRLS
ncbi:MAG: ABC transporter permease [Nocardioides sp.]|uniref:ABC transporter permease n=1 Tax=Nocardioides sp. TaxID=35761 RepID=UPI0039E24E30